MLKRSEIEKAKQESIWIQKRLDEGSAEYLKEYSQESLGEAIGRSPSWVSQALNPLNPTNYLIIQIPFLRRLFGDDLIRQIFEDMNDFRVPRPLVEKFKAGDLRDFAQVLKEFSDLTSAVAEGLKDGKVTRAEAEKIKREGIQAIEHIYAFIQACTEKSKAAPLGIAR